MPKKTSWLYCRAEATHPRMRLFCLPHAGGGSLTFRSWQAALPAFVQVCTVMLPGRETRIAEPLHTELPVLVDDIDRELSSWLDLPYAIFGHSMGALLAFEWARRLHQGGHSAPAWLFLSGRRAPDIAYPASNMHSLPDDAFLKQLNLLYEGIPREMLEDPAMREVFLPVLRADVSIVESYRFREGQPLSCPITAFAGIRDPSVTWEQMSPWKRQTSGRFALHMLPGEHFYPHPPLLQTLTANLNEVQI